MATGMYDVLQRFALRIRDPYRRETGLVLHRWAVSRGEKGSEVQIRDLVRLCNGGWDDEMAAAASGTELGSYFAYEI